MESGSGKGEIVEGTLHGNQVRQRHPRVGTEGEVWDRGRGPRVCPVDFGGGDRTGGEPGFWSDLFGRGHSLGRSLTGPSGTSQDGRWVPRSSVGLRRVLHVSTSRLRRGSGSAPVPVASVTPETGSESLRRRVHGSGTVSPGTGGATLVAKRVPRM